jgi:GNAT superfamily N-acetyltransferase
MAHLKVVEAVEADVPLILEMIRELAEYEKLIHVVSATERQIRDTLFGGRPAAEVLLAWVDHECVGFALFFPNYSTFLAKPGIYLEDLFVKPHARGKGAGAALLAELARIAKRRGCGRVEWAVLNWNEPSIAFYRKLGAVPMHEWTTFRLTGDALDRLASEPAP